MVSGIHQKLIIFELLMLQRLFTSLLVTMICFSVDEIQAACYKILDSAYFMNNLAAATSQRKSIAYEMDKYVLF